MNISAHSRYTHTYGDKTVKIVNKSDLNKCKQQQQKLIYKSAVMKAILGAHFTITCKVHFDLSIYLRVFEISMASGP